MTRTTPPPTTPDFDREDTGPLSARFAATVADGKKPPPIPAPHASSEPPSLGPPPSGPAPEEFLKQLARKLAEELGRPPASPPPPPPAPVDSHRTLKLIAAVVTIALALGTVVWSAAVLVTTKVDDAELERRAKEIDVEHERDQKIDDARLDAIEQQNAVQTEILDRVVKRLE